MTEPRNNEVQRFELAKEVMLMVLRNNELLMNIGKAGSDASAVVALAAFSVAQADALLDFLAALDKPKEGQ